MIQPRPVVHLFLISSTLGGLALGCDDPPSNEATPPVSRICEKSEQSLARGLTVWTEVDSYDADGRRTRTVRTAVDEEAGEHAVDYRYDAAGRLVEEAHDEGANGSIDWTVAWTRNARGDWTLAVSTWPIWSYRHERVFDDASGQLLSERVDDFTNGTWDLLSTQSWEAGRLVQRIEDTFTVPARQVFDYSYDAAGRLVVVRADLGADATADGFVTRVYDAEGRLTEVASRSPDRRWIEGSTFTFDAAGNVVARVWDSTLDGLEASRFVYDEAGNLLTRAFSYGRDGAPPTTRFTWTSGCAERFVWDATTQ